MENIEEKKKAFKFTDEEYRRICELLGREPQGIEWGLFSALWSEHCSYKSSKVHLTKLYTKSSKVVTGVGENAGVVDIGQGERIAFKIESHNHPSYIEPYQGAATGVGGIIRDVLTMGARPIALGNYLCFGELNAPRMRTIIDGVVRGIGGYGNCVGVPMLTGSTQFHSSYDGNVLVNAMCLGYFGPKEHVASAIAKGPGNLIVYVGAKTGKDGVHGARMASESFGKNDADKRPNIQIGDPFFEKLLIESCLEVIQKGLVVAIQDMGAAGLISSSYEMASKGGVGFEMHLDKVPMRDSSLTPEEILVSESQERMLLVCEPEKLPAIREIFKRWGLDSVEIGRILEERVARIVWRGDVLSELDPDLLVENAPRFERPFELPSRDINRVNSVEKCRIPVDDLKKTLLETLSNINGCSRRFVHRQYDQRVGAQTVHDCSQSVGVVRIPSGRSLGIVLGGRPHMMRFDPYTAGLDSIFYPALQLAVKGFEATAVSDGLNYGNPEKPKIMGEFVATLQGMDEACRALHTPIISGNVSFYNETQGRNITSSPMTTIIGVKDKTERIPDEFISEGAVYLIRSVQMELGGLFQEVRQGQATGVGHLKAAASAVFVKEVLELLRTETVIAGRVVGKFGLGYTLARMCLNFDGETGIGADLEVPFESPAELFTERLYEVVLVIDHSAEGAFEQALAHVQGVEVDRLGVTGKSGLTIRFSNGKSTQVSLAELQKAYNDGGRSTFEGLA